MRVNVYHHEIPFMAERAEHVTTIADTGERFHGIRLPVEPPVMHQPGDDDSGAVTLWFPWTRAGGHDTLDMRRIARFILQVCDNVDGDRS